MSPFTIKLYAFDITFAQLRKVFSIALVLLLTFIGISNTLHALETQENHCHNSGEHICLEDNHHSCALCDTVLLPGVVSDDQPTESAILNADFYTPSVVSAPFLLLVKSPLGRAPPLA